MTEQDQKTIIGRARTCKRHIALAQKRLAINPCRQTSEFIWCLQRAYARQCDILHHALLIAVVCIAPLIGGCNTIASIGDLTQSVGKDIKVVAEGTQRRMMEE